jgi:opacity-associated protein A-like protein
MRTLATHLRQRVRLHATLPSMHRRALAVAALVVVAAVFLGPLAMALDGCAALGMCDGPCGLTCAVVFAGPTPVRLQAIAETAVIVTSPPVSATLSALDPPPKSVLSL